MDVSEARKKIHALLKKVCPGVTLLQGPWDKAPEFPHCVVLYKGLKFSEDAGETYGDLDFAVSFIKDAEITNYDNGQRFADYDEAASFTGDLAVKFVNALKKSGLDVSVEGDAPALRYEEGSVIIAGTEINFIVQSD